MTKIDPTELDCGTTLVVEDTDSKYHGTRGTALIIYDDKIQLSLDVHTPMGGVTREFGIEQLRFPS